MFKIFEIVNVCLFNCRFIVILNIGRCRVIWKFKSLNVVLFKLRVLMKYMLEMYISYFNFLFGSIFLGFFWYL